MISTVLYNKGKRIEKMQRDWKVAFSFSASFLFSAGMIRKGILRNCERKRENFHNLPQTPKKQKNTKHIRGNFKIFI